MTDILFILVKRLYSVYHSIIIVEFFYFFSLRYIVLDVVLLVVVVGVAIDVSKIDRKTERKTGKATILWLKYKGENGHFGFLRHGRVAGGNGPSRV